MLPLRMMKQQTNIQLTLYCSSMTLGDVTWYIMVVVSAGGDAALSAGRPVLSVRLA